jgi:hypothetical protein
LQRAYGLEAPQNLKEACVDDVKRWFLRDSPGFPILPELAPLPSEAVFIGLRDCGINAFLIAGVAMEIGIEPSSGTGPISAISRSSSQTPAAPVTRRRESGPWRVYSTRAMRSFRTWPRFAACCQQGVDHRTQLLSSERFAEHGYIVGQLPLQPPPGPALIGEVHDGELRQLHAQLVDQLQPGHTADPGVADDEIAHLQAERELDGGQPVVGLEDGMAVVEQRLDYEAGDGPVLVGDHDEAAVEAGPGGIHCRP